MQHLANLAEDKSCSTKECAKCKGCHEKWSVAQKYHVLKELEKI